MPQIFISYSRVDEAFVEELASLLREHYGFDNVWYDRHLMGGKAWWTQILEHIEWATVFVYVLSNDSVTSPYCLAEYEESQRWGRGLVTIQARDRTKIPTELSQIQYIDMSQGIPDINNARKATKLYEAIALAHQTPHRKRPFWQTPTHCPNVPTVEEEQESAQYTTDETKTLPVITAPKSKSRRIPLILGSLLLVALAIAGGIFALSGDKNNKQNSRSTNTLNPSVAVAENPTEIIPENTLDAFQKANTAFAKESATANFYLTETATRWTPSATSTATFTPDDSATVDAVRTFLAEETAADLTATATQWTKTYTPTPSFTDTYTLTNTATPSNTPTFTPSDTNTPTLRPGYLGGANVEKNGDWVIVEDEFDGVPMVLVPIGCFTMGSTEKDTQASADEKPTQEICFDQPFWIDQYEVTNQQFADLDGHAGQDSKWTGANQPRESITRIEAEAFCRKRGGHLPTESEWEYAARGPNNLIYPWGDKFIADNVVYNGNSGNQTANVGSKPDGKSWVGAYDLSGNVWEWTLSEYKAYPYDKEDGREKPNSNTTYRSIRGGSWGSNSRSVRSAYRGKNYPFNKSGSWGFRCIRPYE